MTDLSTMICQTLAQATPPPLWIYKIPGLVFAFCFGACVGSFINVVAYRLPAGISVISPPSRCPVCGAMLTWRENFPIIGWLMLRGKCKSCGTCISPQYMLIELFMALLFLVLAWRFYLVAPAVPWAETIFGPWWYYGGYKTLPAFTVILILFASLTAMTLIDAKTFTIPIQIPVVATLVAFVGYAIQAWVGLPARGAGVGQVWPIPLVNWEWVLGSFGAMIGLAIAFAMLKLGIMRYSFHDYDEYVKDDEPLADYPHGRREMFIELLYLLPCIVLHIVGFTIGKQIAGSPPLFIAAMGACMTGYLVGGGLVWGIRIFGTFLFGREAMGLGDVHLLAAVGAALGYRDPIFVFFGAAFVGLAWVLITRILHTFFKKIGGELPYGPHLAVATLLVLFAHPWLYPNVWAPLAGAIGVAMPVWP